MTQAAVPTKLPSTNAAGFNSAGLTRIQEFPRILLVGTHLPPDAGSRSVGEGLAKGLRERGFAVRLTSKRRPRALRVLDMLSTVWSARRSYDVVQLDVYSGAAFSWAE